MRKLVYDAHSRVRRPRHFCRGCGKECGYEYCEACAKTETCRHGVIINEGCPECDYEGDIAFDAAREIGQA
jgi:hypothetical protein